MVNDVLIKDSDELKDSEESKEINVSDDTGGNEYMLTTHDNPYDFFTQRKEWLSFDIEHGYDCCGKLARVARLTDDMTDKEECEEIERAIDEIIKYDFLNVYKKVSKPGTIGA